MRKSMKTEEYEKINENRRLLRNEKTGRQDCRAA